MNDTSIMFASLQSGCMCSTRHSVRDGDLPSYSVLPIDWANVWRHGEKVGEGSRHVEKENFDRRNLRNSKKNVFIFQIEKITQSDQLLHIDLICTNYLSFV